MQTCYFYVECINIDLNKCKPNFHIFLNRGIHAGIRVVISSYERLVFIQLLFLWATSIPDWWDSNLRPLISHSSCDWHGCLDHSNKAQINFLTLAGNCLCLTGWWRAFSLSTSFVVSAVLTKAMKKHDFKPGNTREHAQQEWKKEEKRICRYFNTRRGCDHGDECRFLHAQIPKTSFKATEMTTRIPAWIPLFKNMWKLGLHLFKSMLIHST